MAGAFGFQKDLIFDIGANRGEDTAFYLAKGFRVVAIEADPVVARDLADRFPEAVKSGQLCVRNIGVMRERGTLTFYRNLETDLWSSFDPEYGMREGRYETIPVQCVTIADLMMEYGCPYYLKIDVEGADQIILDQLADTTHRPPFLSVEEFGVASYDALGRLGYKFFSLRSQQDKGWAQPVDPPLEGRFVPRVSNHFDSGLFGREVPGWETREDSIAAYRAKVRGPDNAWLPPPGEWYDIHACIRPDLLGMFQGKGTDAGGALRAWTAGAEAELNFWRGQAQRILDKVEPNQSWRLGYREVEMQYRNLIPVETFARSRILDVGCGPFPTQGNLFDGKPISLVCVDALADQFIEIAKEYKLYPPVPPIRCKGEDLSDLFAEGTFDLVTSTNALDHMLSPIDAIAEMFKVCKSGGSVYIELAEDEGQHENYGGQTQYNFRVEDGALIMWTPNGLRVDIDAEFNGLYSSTRKFVDDHPWRNTDWGSRFFGAHYIKK